MTKRDGSAEENAPGRWGASSLVLGAGFGLTGAGTVMLGVLLPALSQRWGLRDDAAGFLFLLQFLGSSFGAILTGLNRTRAVLIGYGLLAVSACALAFAGLQMLFAVFFLFGVGLGMADVVTDRLVNRIDWAPTWVNSLTANTPAAIRTPIHFPTDRECLERIAPTVGKLDLDEVTYGWIRNTMELGRLALSENLRPVVERNPDLEIEATIDFEFAADGNLVSPFAPVAAMH